MTEPVRDEAGLEIPPGLLVEWEARETIEDALGHLRAFLDALRRLDGQIPFAWKDRYAEVEEIRCQAGHMRRHLLNEVRPHGVCPVCSGEDLKGCEACGGAVLLPRKQYEKAANEVRLFR